MGAPLRVPFHHGIFTAADVISHHGIHTAIATVATVKLNAHEAGLRPSRSGQLRLVVATVARDADWHTHSPKLSLRLMGYPHQPWAERRETSVCEDVRGRRYGKQLVTKLH